MSKKQENRSSTGYFNTLFKVEHYQYDYLFSCFVKRCVGELCNFMLGAVFSAVAGAVYKHHKSRKTAIIGAIAGAAAMAVFSVPSNYFITYPAYVQFYHMPLEAILGMYQAILPSADSLIKCLVIFNMPFTLVKGLLDAVLCMLIYKPLSPILHGRK